MESKTESEEMETFWIFLLWFCWSYDPNFGFSLSQKRSYNSGSHSITSENQPLKI